MSSDKVEAEAESRRLFFALWPDESLRQQISLHSKPVLSDGGGRQVKSANLHITLAFLGNVDPGQQSCVESVADKLQGSPFILSIDTAGYWHKPRILWIGPGTMPDILVTLATALRDGALNCGLQMDMRSYNAHMTLMRKVTKKHVEKKILPFTWQVNSFALVRSTSTPEGLVYDVEKEWPLAGVD
jgi:2'-5' RNA ligase